MASDLKGSGQFLAHANSLATLSRKDKCACHHCTRITGWSRHRPPKWPTVILPAIAKSRAAGTDASAENAGPVCCTALQHLSIGDAIGPRRDVIRAHRLFPCPRGAFVYSAPLPKLLAGARQASG